MNRFANGRLIAGFSLMVPILLSGCGGGDGDSEPDTNKSSMCYTKSGTTVTINCQADYLGSCAAAGKTLIGSYGTWSTCNNDVQTVLNKYSSTGSIDPGPNSSQGSGSGGSGSSGGSTSGNADALAYPQVSYSFSCSSGGSSTVNVANGPCLSSQKPYTKATSCNEYDANFTFNSVGKPFYQCLVNNSTGDYKKTYQQYLSYFGG
jgi:hypothetical protein